MNTEVFAIIFYVTASIASLLVIATVGAILYYGIPVMKMARRIFRKILSFFIKI